MLYNISTQASETLAAIGKRVCRSGEPIADVRFTFEVPPTVEYMDSVRRRFHRKLKKRGLHQRVFFDVHFHNIPDGCSPEELADVTIPDVRFLCAFTEAQRVLDVVEREFRRAGLIFHGQLYLHHPPGFVRQLVNRSEDLKRAGHFRPGTVTGVSVEHAEGCASQESGDEWDCDCEPRLEVATI